MPEHAPAASLPGTAIVEVFGTDLDGEPLARLVAWQGAGRPPTIIMAPERPGQPALAPGERVLARLRRRGAGEYEGRTLRRLGATPGRVLGVYRGPQGGPGRIAPALRRDRQDWLVPAGAAGEAAEGELVLAEALPHARLGLRPARIIERLGRPGEARAASLVAIHTHGIPDSFPPAALAEAEAAGPCPPDGRDDLRHLPLVTIDGADARDFDDAVFAAARPDGGYDLLVAIADVAHYVPAAGALDGEARNRGNSVYFPDRVVPMLPEPLSNGWCSLKPGEDRPVLAMAISIDADGRKTAHRVLRGLMRSAARLTYARAQADFEAGAPALQPLFGAFAALARARTRRGTLDLDLPERKVTLAAGGRVASIDPAPRLDSHRLIEELMILANVAAAEALEAKAAPLLYRVHDRPAEEKHAALRAWLASLGIPLAPSKTLLPKDFSGVLARVRGTPHEAAVNEMVLRTQAQAEYATANVGHFGLALARYAHFTSPIRRYADLVVHRALIRAYRLGGGGLQDAGGLEELAAHVTMTERRAIAAERDAMDRYMAAFMADQIGARFDARISGVTRYGIFATLLRSGASGLVPMRALPDDFWILDDAAHTLTGRHSGISFRLGQPLPVRLVEANAATGSLVLAPDLPPPARRGRPKSRLRHRPPP